MKKLKKIFIFMLSLFLIVINCTHSFAMGGNVNTNKGNQFLDYEISNIRFSDNKMYIYGYAYINGYQDFNTSPKKCTSVSDLKNKVSGSYTHGYYLTVGDNNYVDVGGSDNGINYNAVNHTDLNWVDGASNNKNYKQVGFGFIVPLDDLLVTDSSQTFTLKLHIVLNDGSDSSINANYINSGQTIDADNYTISYPAISSSNYITPTGDQTLVRTGPDKSYSPAKDSSGHNLYFKKGSQYTAYNGTLTGNRSIDSNSVTWFQVRYVPTGKSDSIGGVTRYRVAPSSSGSYGWIASTFADASQSVFSITVTRKKYNVSSSITNGTITQTSTVLSGNNKTITWNANSNYYVSSIAIDGANVNVSSRRSGSYTFNNVKKNHSVSVACNPCFVINTTISNGKITGSVGGIDPNQNKTITFSPNDGYYVSQIIVDGYAYSYKDYPNSYTFSNITSNHSIDVVCEPLKTITTEISNGVITKTLTNLHPDDIKDINFNAFYEYYIQSVVVDGKSITVKDFEEGNYEFDTVVTDHFIKVVCLPKPKITTEILNGFITPTITVFPNEDKTVTATANDGYYINRILVDGKEISGFGEYQNTYKFENITSDHDIYIECELIPNIDLKIYTDKEAYNYKDKIQYTIELAQPIENAIANNLVLKSSDLTRGISIDMNSFEILGVDDYILQKYDNDYTFKIDKLYHNQKVKIKFIAIVEDKTLVSKNIINNVYATAEHFNSQVHDRITNPILKPILDISNTTDKDKYNVYEEIEYKICIKQIIEGAKAFNVNFENTFPSGIKLNLDTLTVNGVNNILYEFNQEKNQIKLNIDEINDKEDINISLKGYIENPKLSGDTIVSNARITSETNTDIKEDDVKNYIYKPQLVLLKSMDKEHYNVEDEANFDISLTQTVENAVAYNVLIKDTDISNGVDIDMKSLSINGIDRDNYYIRKSSNGFEVVIKRLSNEIVNIRYMARINDNSLAGTVIKNTVLANCENNTEEVKSSVEKPVLKPELTISKISDDAIYNVKDEIEFTLNVTQTIENAIANKVVIKDFDLTDGIKLDLDSISVYGIDESVFTVNKDYKNNLFTIVINTLAYNQSVTVKVKGKIIDAKLAGKTISNSASVKSENSNQIVTDKVNAEIHKPKLAIQKTSDKDSYNYNDTIKYCIDISQMVDGARANDIVVNDVISDGVSVDMNSFTFENLDNEDVNIEKTKNGFNLNIKSLSDNCKIFYKAKITDPTLAGKDIVNRVKANASNHVENIENSTSGKVIKPKLEVQKTSDRDSYNYDDTIKYCIDISQIMDDAKAYDIVVNDIISDGVSVDMNSFTFENLDNEDVNIEKTKNGFNLNIKSLSDNCKIFYKAKITDPTLAGKDIVNKVKVNASNNVEYVNDRLINTVISPEFEINKIADSEYYNLNDTIHYTVRARQTNNQAKAYNIVLNDSYLNDGLKINSKSIDIDGVDKEDYSLEIKEQGYILHIDSVSNEEIQIDYDVNVIAPSLAGQKIEHEVYISCLNNPIIKSWKSKIENVILKPNFILNKSSNVDKVKVNDTIHYNLNLSQTNKDAISKNIILTDIIDDNQRIDMKSINISSSSQYSLKENNDGFSIIFDCIEGIQNTTIEYDAVVIDDKKATAINTVYLQCDGIENVLSQTSIDIYDEAIVQTDDTFISPNILLLSMGVSFVSYIYLLRKKVK